MAGWVRRRSGPVESRAGSPASAEASSWQMTIWRGAAGVQAKARKQRPVARGEFPKVAGRSNATYAAFVRLAR
jgi:hypothetical protein